jgi:hypothetical protein
MLSLTVDQQIDYTPGIRSAIDIVAKEDLHGVPYWPGTQISVNTAEQREQKVGSPMHVAYGVNALSGRGARFCLFPAARA